MYHKGEKVVDLWGGVRNKTTGELWEQETMQELTAPAVPATHGFFDECLRIEVPFSLGFTKPNSGFPFVSARAFGFPGAGGSLGFADPEAQIGYAYVPNRKGTTMGGDPRDVALRRALFSTTPAARTIM